MKRTLFISAAVATAIWIAWLHRYQLTIRSNDLGAWIVRHDRWTGTVSVKIFYMDGQHTAWQE